MTCSISEMPKKVIIDLSEAESSQDIQIALKKGFGFPDYYGMNWDAFWDGITGLVKLPAAAEIRGVKKAAEKLPGDIEMLEKLIKKYKEEFGKTNITLLD